MIKKTLIATIWALVKNHKNIESCIFVGLPLPKEKMNLILNIINDEAKSQQENNQRKIKDAKKTSKES